MTHLTQTPLWRQVQLILGILLAAPCGCSSATTNRNPTGERFPSVVGTPLSGGELRVPEDLDALTVLLVAYEQDAQFDVDRWLLGLLDKGVGVQIYELPTIEGLVPGLLSGTIDDGMRSGIPDPDEASVVTIYDGAEKIVALTGNQKPRLARVLLVDARGEILWFHDQGYSARILLKLSDAIKTQSEENEPANP